MLMAADPGYLANLMAQPAVERERLLGGNWKIRPAAGLLFQRGWCQIVDAVPAGVRWRSRTGEKPKSRSLKILGQAGKSQVTNLVKLLSGFVPRATPESGDKVTQFSPFSAQAEAGNVLVLRGSWNDDWFTALEGFPEAKHDDDAVKAKGEAYLPMKSGTRVIADTEKRGAAYDFYRLRAEFPELVAPTIRGAVGTMLDQVTTIELPKALERLRERATRDGLTLEALHRQRTDVGLSITPTTTDMIILDGVFVGEEYQGGTAYTFSAAMRSPPREWSCFLT